MLAVTAPPELAIPTTTPVATRASEPPLAETPPGILPEMPALLDVTEDVVEQAPALPPSPTATPTLAPRETANRDIAPAPSPEPAAPTASLEALLQIDRVISPVVEMGWQTVTRDGQTTSEWVVPEYAAGWHLNSRLPGQGGNIVLSGHNNILGQVFRYIVDLESGEEVTLYSGERTFIYLVQEKYVLKEKGQPLEVRQANARWIGPFDDERLTLVSCWPYTNNTHRVIVVARPRPSALNSQERIPP